MQPVQYRAFGTLRFALALTVLLSHSWFLTYGLTERHFIQDVGIGNFAVMSFFVLSGFIIAEALDVFYRGRVCAFVANRALRLLPPYWAAALLSIATHFLLWKAGILRLPDYAEIPSNIFSRTNLAIQLTGIIPVFNLNKLFPPEQYYYFVRFAWAVFVEFVFYYVAAICTLAWPLASRYVRIGPYLACCGTCVLIVHVVSEYIRPLHTSLAFVPYFVLGVALYTLVVRRTVLALWFCVIAYVLIAVHYIRYTQGQLPLTDDWWSGLANPTVWLPTAAMLLIPLLLVPLARLDLSERAVRVDQWFGDLTYPLYLNHYVVLVAACSLFNIASPVLQLAAVTAAIAMAWLMKAAVERPMKPLRDRLRGRAVVN